VQSTVYCEALANAVEGNIAARYPVVSWGFQTYLLCIQQH